MIELDFKKSDGLIPAIVQDWKTNEVLMLAYVNEISWKETLSSGYATYWSRSRGKLWKKGESSGHLQIVKEISIDCDNDTILLKVDQIGGACCHEGYRTCFFRRLSDGKLETVGERVFNPEEKYGKK